MNRIIAPIEPGVTGPEVANLQDALLALLDRKIIRALDAPNPPTPEELQKLTAGLKQERDQSRFGKTTQQLIVYFQLQQGLGDSLRGVVENKTAATLNELLKSIGAFDNPDVNPDKAGFVVRGHVAGASAGQIVLAYDKDFRGEELLGKSEIDPQSNYEIHYRADRFQLAEKGTADLRVAVCEPGGRELVSSEIHFNAAPETTIDLTVGPGPAIPSEYERYLTDLEPVLHGVALIDIDVQTPELKDNDLHFLAGDTGIDRQHIAWLVQAARLAHETRAMTGTAPGTETRVRVPVLPISEIPAAVFYGMLRQGLSRDLKSLLEHPINDLIAELKKSIEANIVPRVLLDRLGAIEAALNQLRAARLLAPAAEGKPSSLGDLLRTLPPEQMLSGDQQLTVARLRHEHGNTDEFWKQAEAAGLSNTIPALKRTLVLGELSLGHAPLVQALQAKADVEHPESVEFVTKLKLTEVIELVFEHGVLPGRGLDRDGYIEQFQANIENKFPMLMLRKQLEGKLSESESFPTVRVVDFLKANSDFDLRTQHVEPYLNETGNQDDHLRKGLLQLQRIHALTANARETGVLLEAGYGSATQMVHEGKPAFELRVRNQLSPGRAEEVFAAAENVVTTVVALGTAYASPAAAGNAVHVIPAPAISQETLEKYPSLRSLFGDLDYCECRHCQSVLGPAAYLADLMHFLQRSPLNPNPGHALSAANLDNLDPLNPLNLYLESAAGNTVLGALLKRRPDLADLELSCENTNTEIPYIDLVLEILENAVGLPLVVDPSEYAGIDIRAEFLSGRVPDVIAKALTNTDIKVGKNLTVTDCSLPAGSTPLNLDNWIIKDGSRRWLVQHIRPQLILLIATAAGPQYLSVLDAVAAVKALAQGRLTAELENKLSQGLPLTGAPQIQEVPVSINGLRVWTASYTRAIAIKITMGAPMGAVELLKLDGTGLRSYQWPLGVMQNIAHAFTTGASSKINANVALLLGIPADEPYLQTWNATRNWWELSITNRALLAHGERLTVSGLTYQNSSIREHLKSSPENRNPAAYEKLAKNAVFPWALPFDLWLEETHGFLGALGAPRATLIDLARPQSRLSDEAAALELLGLSKSEADLIAPATTPTEPWAYWGLAEKNNTAKDHTAGFEWQGGWLEVLAHLSMLLQQSGLSYREYLDLLQTRFVGKPKLILFPPNECKTSKIVLTGLTAAEFTDHLHRVHVFTRLWRKAGWSMRELDLAIAAFGGQINATTLQNLALQKRLQAELGLPLPVLIGCIDKLETLPWTDHIKEGTPVQPSLYNSVFQRQSLVALAGFEDLSLNAAGSELNNTTLKVSARAGLIAASLGVKPATVLRWVNPAAKLGVPDAINLSNLSRLYAAVSLCRALGIAPDTLPDYCSLLGSAANPFGSALLPADRTRSLLEFTERVGFVRKSGFDFESMNYLLQHRVRLDGSGDAGTKLDRQLAQTLTELRSALQSGVVLGNGSADNVKRQLARLGWYPALIDAAMGSDGLNYQPGASIDITPPLATEPAIPLDLRSKFSYQKLDSAKGELKCTGSLTDSDFASIENLFPSGRVAALKTRYNDRLQARAETLARLMRAFELSTFMAVINNLKVQPVIPGAFAGRLGFELTSATEGTLKLTGWLSDDERILVSDVNPGNVPLTDALKELQRQSSTYTPVQPFIVTAEAEQLLREPDVEKRYRSLLLRLVSRLELDLLVAHLREALACDPQVVEVLLDAARVPKANGRSSKLLLTDSEFLSSDTKSVADRTTWPNQFAVLELLGKITTIVNRLTITPEQLDWVLGQAFTVMDVLALPTSVTPAAASFDDWHKLVDLFHLRDVLPDGAQRLAQVHEALKRDDYGTVRGVFAKALELDGQQQADDACDVGLLNFDSAVRAPNDYNNPSRLLELARLLHVIKALGTTSRDIRRLTQPSPDEADAQLARKLFATSIDAGALPERVRPISDRLRNLQRNALVAYLIHRDHLIDSNELFDRYLIDVEMGSCMLTSRIKQAISSVQLFVQRCLLNLEPGTASDPRVSPACIDVQRWQWMKFYRVWEANRKVFLYPENWIEPELRDDKTEIFEAFESDLTQSELTHDAALVAFRRYLDKLADVANLTVVSMFEEQTDDGGSIVHLVGRDNSEPYKHYYRQWKLRAGADFGTWTAWEEISAQLASEHVLVFVFGGSVYLAWPTIASGQSGNLKWKIGMNLAKRTTSGWTKLKKGRGEIEAPMLPHTMESYPANSGRPALRIKYEKDERNSLAFRITYNNPNLSDETVSLATYGPPPQEVGEEPSETKQESISDVYDPDEGRIKFGGIYIRDPFLHLKLRVLDSYVYQYAGGVKQACYKPSKDLKVKITVTYTVTYKKFHPAIAGEYIDRPEKRPNEPILKPESNVVDYQDSFSNFTNLYDAVHGPHSDPVTGHTDTRRASVTLVDALKIKVTVSGSALHKTPTVTKEFVISKGTTFTWQEDFIFELKDAPLDWLPLLPSGNPTLVQSGSFRLNDDDSLELEPATGKDVPTPSRISPATENFLSGYRELQSSPHSLALSPTSLSDSPGQYFIVQAASKQPPAPEIYAYRDDRFSVLFWRGEKPDGSYRVVPFSTGGMRKLTSAVTKGRLLDAVKLPLPGGPPTLPGGPPTAPGGPLTLTPISLGVSGFDQNSVIDIKIDFEKVPTSTYNWEVFFHNPLMVATQLSQAQRFEEAQRWFHLIFDPTTNEAGLESVRYWRFLPFRKNGKGVAIDEVLQGMARGRISLTDEINEWALNPFRPHLVARHRLRSYQFAVVQKYLENLIAWGDQLFRRDTIESINEATQLYVLAARILGKRPASSPKPEARPKSYRDIYRQLDDFSNAWIPLEGLAATALFSNAKSYRPTDEQVSSFLNSLGGLYFCVPGNEKLSEYWDTLDDRLFKIRHCLNLEGVERQLPLFEPPIDPALLVRAAAAGLDLATVLSGMQAPLPLYRFNVMMQKALELCGEVRALGNALLGALEKQDAEELSLLRSSHEIQMLKLVRAIKEQQQKEAETNLEALRKTREITAQRYVNYQRLMGKQNVVVPAEGSVAPLESSTLQLAPPSAGDTDTEGLALISAEAGHMGWLNDANNFSLIAGSLSVVAGVLHAIPESIVGPVVYQAMTGGSHLGSAVNAASAAVGMLATNASFQGGRSATIGGHQRRFDEWKFQSNTAAKELEQIDKQILANEIRKQIAEHEITNHDKQMENSQEVDEFMRDKFTKKQLYSWMVGQISNVYFRTYQLAHDIAKRAERTYRFELGLKDSSLKDSSFIDFGYWDNLKEGLLSGERLYLDLKRMDAAYLDKNKREYEITKHVSLVQLDPVALLQLKETGKCEVSLPEALLDMDFPGHYLRRIKSLSLTIPCVTGPYSSVPCTLTLLKHSVRHSSSASGNYARDIENDDPRFIDSFGAIQSIVTSSAQNDSGLFETNLRDERYLPFEGAGVISTWRLELPAEFRQFNYDAISDVILHLRYTSREGGDLKTGAVKNIDNLVKNAAAAGSVRLFSMRLEFPTEWAQFKKELVKLSLNPKVFAKLTINLELKHYPFWAQNILKTANPTVTSMELYAKESKASVTIAEKIDGTGNVDILTTQLDGLVMGPLAQNKLPSPIGNLTIFIDDNSMEDLWLVLAWAK